MPAESPITSGVPPNRELESDLTRAFMRVVWRLPAKRRRKLLRAWVVELETVEHEARVVRLGAPADAQRRHERAQRALSAGREAAALLNGEDLPP